MVAVLAASKVVLAGIPRPVPTFMSPHKFHLPTAMPSTSTSHTSCNVPIVSPYQLAVTVLICMVAWPRVARAWWASLLEQARNGSLARHDRYSVTVKAVPTCEFESSVWTGRALSTHSDRHHILSCRPLTWPPLTYPYTHHVCHLAMAILHEPNPMYSLVAKNVPQSSSSVHLSMQLCLHVCAPQPRNGLIILSHQCLTNCYRPIHEKWSSYWFILWWCSYEHISCG